MSSDTLTIMDGVTTSVNEDGDPILTVDGVDYFNFPDGFEPVEERVANIRACREADRAAETTRSPADLDAFWQVLTDDLSPDLERMLRRLVKAQARLLAEMVRIDLAGDEEASDA